MILLIQALALRGKTHLAAASRGTRWQKAQSMSLFGQRALLRAAMLAARDVAPPKPLPEITEVRRQAERHVSRPLRSFDPRTSLKLVVAMEPSHAEGVNHWLEENGQGPRRIVAWDDWSPSLSDQSVVLNVRDEAWSLLERRNVERLDQDVDRAVSYEYDRQAESLGYYASQLALRL